MQLGNENWEEVETITLNHYTQNADAFWAGTKDHDVTQNYAAFWHLFRQPKPWTFWIWVAALAGMSIISSHWGTGRLAWTAVQPFAK